MPNSAESVESSTILTELTEHTEHTEDIEDTVDTVWSFCHQNSGGNAAGICFPKNPLEPSLMQAIANQVGYSETVFIQMISNNRIHMRYFTPTSEVGLCGHATIAGFYWLQSRQLIKEGEFTLLTQSEELKVWVESEQIFMEQPAVQLSQIASEFNDLLSKLSRDIDLSNPLHSASTGIVDLMLPFKSLDGLKNFQADDVAISNVCLTLGVEGIHAYTKVSEKSYLVRNFAPLLGISEESATGTSNCALSGLLDILYGGQEAYVFSQGMWMNQPSEIITKRINRGHFSVGGRCRE